MTVANDVAKVRITTNGTTGPYALTGGDGALVAVSPAHLVATHLPTGGAPRVLTYGADYSISGDITIGSASLVAASALAAGILSVRRETPRIQAAHWANGDGNPSPRFESTSDYSRLIDQEIGERAERALVSPEYGPTVNMDIPLAFFDGSKILSFDPVNGVWTVQDPMVVAAQAAAAQAVGAAALITAAVGMYSTPVGSIVNAPAGGEASGTRYIVGTSPTGAFAGKANYIAQLNGATWVFAPPLDGLQIQIKGQGFGYSYTNGAWTNKFVFNFDTAGLNDSLNPMVDFTMFTGSDAFCITSLGDNAGGAFHLHKARGVPGAATKPLNGDYLMSCGIRGLSGSTGKFSGSSAAILCNLLEDSDFTYSKCIWSFEGTRATAGVREPWHTMKAGLHGFGKDAADPAHLITARFDQDTTTSVRCQNYSVGSSAKAKIVADNGIHTAQLICNGTGVGVSGVTRGDGMELTTDGPGGICVYTGGTGHLFFGTNNLQRWYVDGSSGDFLPNSNNSFNIGSSGAAVKNIYSVNALNVTSDEATKTDIRDLTEQEIAAGDAVKWVMFKHKGGDRLHAGVVAQQVEAAFATAGLDPYAYGVIGTELLSETVVEDYEDWADVPVTHLVTHQDAKVDIIDGKAVRIFVPREEVIEVTDSYPLHDGVTGEPVKTPQGEAIYHQVVRTERKLVAMKREVVKPIMLDGVQQKRRFVRYAELTAFCLAAHEARLDALEGVA